MEKLSKQLLVQLGSNFKKLRIKEKLTQDQVSDMLSLSRPSICNIESGVQSMSCLVLIKAVKIFNCTFDDLMSIDFDVDIGEVNNSKQIERQIERRKRKIAKLESQLQVLKSELINP